AMNTAQVLAAPDANVHLYVCGPGGFMQHVLDSARAQGWQEECLHREYFAAAPLDSSLDAGFSVKLASSGQVFDVPADRSVVQV
ncbi:oxidoreductase, partial [Salmonella enterica subsp. enterica serovar Javiana]|nr:oxidoreductase [Salmonella enterica subsp. enterica serovar Javiana]